VVGGFVHRLEREENSEVVSGNNWWLLHLQQKPLAVLDGCHVLMCLRWTRRGFSISMTAFDWTSLFAHLNHWSFVWS
jgi:hypothetical protein